MKTRLPQSTALPSGTIALAAAALCIWASPDLSTRLTLTRANWMQVSPIFTGHLCHWTGAHLFWDLLVFAVAGTLVERRLGCSYLPWLAVAAAAIAAAVLFFLPAIGSYRGLSGIDTFLYTFAVLAFVREMYPNAGCARRVLLLVPPLLLFAKLLFELIAGQALFAGSLGADVVSVPLAHFVGALVGAAAAVIRRWPWQEPRKSSARIPPPRAPHRRRD